MATATAEIETLTATEVKRARGTLRLGRKIVKGNMLHNDYENDAVEIPVVKKMRFKFNKPTKVEFV